MTRSVLLDTDIGTDIDDAVCLAYLLAQPACDLVGITTVRGQPDQRARLASALCQVAGREEIPIRVGCGPAMFGGGDPDLPRQARALERWDHATDFGDEHAVEFLRRTIRARPHELTLLAIGPLTNIGLLFALDPEIPGLLKELVLMCGRFANPIPNLELAEWNARCDPHATALVYQARPPVHRSVGVCVTRQTVLPAAEVRRRFTAPLLRPVLDFAEVWFEHCDALTFHDPLAAATLFDDELVTWEAGTVSVDLDSRLVPGLTRFAPGAGPHEVARTVQAERFFDHYFARFA